MSSLGRSLGHKGYAVLQMPQDHDAVDQSFATLPPDPYYAGRCRRFSQYLLFHQYACWHKTLERSTTILPPENNNIHITVRPEYQSLIKRAAKIYR